MLMRETAGDKRLKILTMCCLVMTVTLISCGNPSVVVHDEMKAIEIVNANLKHIMNADYENAYNMYDDEFRNNTTLLQFKDSMIGNFGVLGKFEKITFEYYLIIGAEPLMELLYTADFEKEKNVPLHFIVGGDLIKGYEIKVIDFGYVYKPFGEDDERQHFTIDKEIVIEAESDIQRIVQ